MSTKHPLQPLVIVKGVLRFKENKIVSKLLEFASQHGCGLNELVCMEFPKEDWQQFNQLIGYSHSGIHGMDEESWQAAEAMYRTGMTEHEARYNHARDTLNMLRKNLRNPMAELFEIHPDDLTGGE